MTELEAASFDRDKLVRTLRQLEPTFRQEGVTSLALFGSRARGDNRPDSDIDVLIEVEAGRRFSLLDLIGVRHVIEDNTALHADVLMRRSLKPAFSHEIASEEVPVF